MIITEIELRANWHKNKESVITLPQGSVITPAARDFIRSKGIQIQIEGEGIRDINKNTFANARHTMPGTRETGTTSGTDQMRTGVGSYYAARRTSPAGAKDSASNLQPAGGPDKPVKPEHMTHLRNNELVTKTHPVIALRGQLDLFQCELADVQVFFQQEGEETLIRQLEEIAAFARQLMVCEVKREPFVFTTLIGLNADELREHSHYPGKYFGVEHTPLSYTHGKVVAKLHLLRAKAREVEQYANRAFTDEQGNCTRPDLVQALNRLSSAFYILACEVRSRAILEKKVPIGISNRHVHLSLEDMDALFGENYELTVENELSQPGEFAAQETVTLVGPKGYIEDVRVLGPARKKTQVEVSVTDCFRLGIKPVVRDSGQHEGTPGLMLVGTVGNVDLEKGAIVAGRHIHLHTEEAKCWLLKNGDRVRVQIPGKRPVLFDDVLVRVSDSYRMEMHLDTDEANAALIGTQSHGLILGVKHDE